MTRKDDLSGNDTINQGPGVKRIKQKKEIIEEWQCIKKLMIEQMDSYNLIECKPENW
jgi:hypothetical protein